MDDEIAAAIRIAREAIAKAGLDEESPLAVAAFEAILTRTLAKAESHLGEHEGDAQSEAPGMDSGPADPASRIAAWAGVDAGQVRDYFLFGDGSVVLEVPARVLSRRRADLQRQLALLKLTLDRVGFDREDVPAAELGAICQAYGCFDQNMPRNIVAYQNYILRHGRGRSSTYRLTQPGRDAGRELIRDLLSAA